MEGGEPGRRYGSASTRRGLYHGWRVVGAAFMIALFGWGLGFYGPGIYLLVLSERHGWPVAGLAPAVTAYYLLGAALVMVAGRTFERFGPRVVVIAGTCAMASGLVLLTLASEPWMVWAAFAVMSPGWAAMSGAAVNIVVAPWFDRRRGLAVSIALNGASVGGVAMAPLLVVLTESSGFGTAVGTAVLAMGVILIPVVAVVLRPKRPDEQDRADARSGPSGRWPSEVSPPPLAGILRSGTFRTISIPFALALTAQVGLLTHQVAILSPLTGPVAAGWLVSLTTAAAVVGRIGTGLFVDRVDPRAVACANFLVQAVGTSVLATASSGTAALLGCVLFGLGVGNLISLPGLIVQREFPGRDFARVVSLIVAINQVTFAFGPALLGYLRQADESYGSALGACVLMQLAAALVVVLPRLRAIVSGPGTSRRD